MNLEGRKAGRRSRWRACVLLGLVLLPSVHEQGGVEAFHLSHDVNVPAEYRSGRGWIHGLSDIERYVGGYEKGWWACVQDRAGDIRGHATSADEAAIRCLAAGTAATFAGFYDGYRAADARIDGLVEGLGAPEARRELRVHLAGT